MDYTAIALVITGAVFVGILLAASFLWGLSQIRKYDDHPDDSDVPLLIWVAMLIPALVLIAGVVNLP